MTPNTEISRTVGYKSASRCLKIPWCWYFKFWKPAGFNRPTVINWKANAKLLQGCALHGIFNCGLCVWSNNHLYQSWNVYHTCGHDSSVCLRLCDAVVSTFMSQSCRVIFLEIRHWRRQQKWFTDTRTFYCSVFKAN